jgi:nucleotide-binding universal stress UspA family protein
MYRSILVPLDGSPFAEHALPRALMIAQHSGATVHLVHVHVPSTQAYVLDIPPADDTLDRPSREYEREYLARLVQRITAKWQVPVTQALLDGSPVVTLHDHALKIAADLVVMTTHGHSPLTRLWLGSVADALVRQVSAPVLLVRPYEEASDFLQLDREQPFKRVLIPLDGSRLAEAALDHAVALAGGRDVEYTLIQAIEPILITYLPLASGNDVDEQSFALWRAEAREYLERMAQRLPTTRPVRTQVIVAPPAGAILSYACQHGIDLIAMATHGRSGISRVLLGSVADKVVRGTHIPVLLHRPSALGLPLSTEQRVPANVAV